MTPPLLSVFLDYFPFFPVKSRQYAVWYSKYNNVFMNLLCLFTKDKVFKYLDAPITSVELNNWPRKMVEK